MDKRYQIFISSTFSDLKDERNKVMRTIMSLSCIPSGMELFPATDEEQFEFIKRIIDDCDYYLLIIGARYGSMDESGVSYTEKEYDYAFSKGIPVMAFLHHDISSLPMNKADVDPDLRQKLENFRKKVETRRLVQYYENADDLNAKVAISLPQTIKIIPRTGWVKANLMANSEVLQEINDLRKENEELRAFKAKYEKETVFASDYADWDEEFCAHFIKKNGSGANQKEIPIEISYTWLEWFKTIALALENSRYYDTNISTIINGIISKKESIDSPIYIENADLSKIRYQFTIYDVITKDFKTIGDPYFHQTYEIWRLTKKGEKLIAQLLCVKTNKH